jgi:uncharacterized membrane protein YqjE
MRAARRVHLRRASVGGADDMLAPDAALILAFALLALLAYGLWAGDRLPRLRTLIAVLAVFALVGAVVAHDVEVAHVVEDGLHYDAS